MECKHIITNLLKDAYALEQAIIELLEQHGSDTEDSELKTRLEDKADSINDRAEKIKERVEQLDDEVSTAKTGLAAIIRNMEDYPAGYEKGRLIKDTIVEYGAEYIEKATFKALLAAAKECRDEQTINLCNDLIGDEAETAEFLDQNLGDTVTDYIQRETVESEEMDFTGEGEDEGQI